MKEIRAIAKRIAEKFDVDKIILFGSYANGKATGPSDVDLLVVSKTKIHYSELRYQIYTELKDIPIPLDVVIKKPYQIDTAKQRRDWFLMNILKYGRSLYTK
ncbi:MAG: nucleotidyltransferase domain-containing protein [Ignavibacteriales bacterium]|nr:nucleotidyltransferase domain-containing protein [Ignavibacteriales bacterium]